MKQFFIFISVFFVLMACQITWIIAHGRKKKWLANESTTEIMVEQRQQYFRFLSNFGRRLNVSWTVYFAFALAFLLGSFGITLLFLLASFLALREFVSIMGLKSSDYWPMFFAFYVFLPLQYFFVWADWQFLFYIFLPVYGFLFSPMLAAMSSDSERFFERAAKFQWAQIACIYCLSYAPAISQLPLKAGTFESSTLLLFLLIVIAISDAFQYIFGSLWGKKKIAPVLSPNKTWEGAIFGILLATFIGTCFYWLTPFKWYQTVLISFLVCIIGFLGGLVMSGIKRSLKIKDWGDVLGAHGGILDRFDSLVFAAPFFYHLSKYYYS